MQYDIGAVQQRIQASIWSKKIIGNYEIVKKIGEGSFSSVFLAVHTITRHEVVLKSADKTQANIASEIANMSLLSHPHIVRLYEYIIMPDKVWLVLEYCGGQELYNYLTASKVILPALACRLFAQLAGAVAYAHQLHCAHRDLKLENVLLDNDGNIKLGDFGFTRTYVPRTMLETVCGTESYMAPELVLRQKYNPEAADVWSLGVILYAMLYGRLPFDEDSSADTIHHIIESDPSFPPVLKGDFLVEIARKMLSKNPSQRPKMVDVLDLLREPGRQQKQLLTQITNHPESSYIFSSKEERTVLKGMKALSIDLHAVASSIMHHKCDSLHGLWFTALDRHRSLSKQLMDAATGSNSNTLNRRKSKASIKSNRSLKAPKTLGSYSDAANTSVISGTGNLQISGMPAAATAALYGNVISSTFSPLTNNFSTPVKAVSTGDTSFHNDKEEQFKHDLLSSPLQPHADLPKAPSQSNSLTGNRVNEKPSPVAASSPKASNGIQQDRKVIPMTSAKSNSSILPESEVASSLDLPVGSKWTSKHTSSITEFIERRSTGRSKRAMKKIISILKLPRSNNKENLLAYYDSIRENDYRLLEMEAGRAEPSFSPAQDMHMSPLDNDGVNGANDSSIKDDFMATNKPRRNSVEKQLSTPVLDLGRSTFSAMNDRRQSSASLSSSLSMPPETPVRSQAGLGPQTGMENASNAVQFDLVEAANLLLPSSHIQKSQQQQSQKQSQQQLQRQESQNQTQSRLSPQHSVPSQQSSQISVGSSQHNAGPHKPVTTHESTMSQTSQTSMPLANPTLAASNISRPMSAYSQISQISQLSQSSVDASTILEDLQESKNVNPLMTNGIRRSNSAIIKKYSGVAVATLGNTSSNSNVHQGLNVNASNNTSILSASSGTPPGTPTMSRPRARLMSIKQKIPQKIEEGDE